MYGQLINVEIRIAPFQYKGAQSSIAIASDITERLEYLKAIEAQNEKLRAISWMQSHVIRAPLARIMGLIPIIIDLKTKKEEKMEMLNYLSLSANELDNVIRDITEVTSIVPVK